MAKANNNALDAMVPWFTGSHRKTSRRTVTLPSSRSILRRHLPSHCFRAPGRADFLGCPFFHTPHTFRRMARPGVHTRQRQFRFKTPNAYRGDDWPAVALSRLSDTRAFRRFGAQNRTLLHRCVTEGSAEWVLAILRDGRVDSSAKRLNGHTALHDAAERGDESIVLALLKCSRIDVNATALDGCTALHLACKHDNALCVQALLQDGRVNPNIQDKHGDTSLGYIFMYKSWSTWCWLLSKPALSCRWDPNVPNVFGNTALHLAVWYCVEDDCVVALLRMKNVDVNARNWSGNTPLLMAFLRERFPAAMVLLQDPRVDVNITNNDGNAALHACCPGLRMYNLPVATALVNHATTNVNIRDMLGRTVLERLLDRSRDPWGYLGYRRTATFLLQSLVSTGRVDLRHPFSDGSLAVDVASKLDDPHDAQENMLVLAPYINDEQLIRHSRAFTCLIPMVEDRRAWGFSGAYCNGRSRRRLVECLVLLSVRGHGCASLMP